MAYHAKEIVLELLHLLLFSNVSYKGDHSLPCRERDMVGVDMSHKIAAALARTAYFVGSCNLFPLLDTLQQREHLCATLHCHLRQNRGSQQLLRCLIANSMANARLAYR